MQEVLTDARLPDFLRRMGLFGQDQEVRVEPAGDGNINWVRRAFSPGGKSLVVKQARPALERFPQYRASTERILFEARWLELARPFDDAGVCPLVLAFDEPNRVLVFEDLGQAERLDEALARGVWANGSARTLATFLGRVHAGTREVAPARFHNEEMQRLHGDHIFALPLESNDFPLPPRTRERAGLVKADSQVRAAAREAYERYLTPRGCLVHGDVQAGNVLLAARGPVLLDAEIAHIGDPAFDIGTLLAHLALPAVARGTGGAAASSLESAWAGYVEAHGRAGLASFASVARYAGLELMRRTIGAARVAAVADDTAGLRVLEAAVEWIVAPPQAPGELLEAA